MMTPLNIVFIVRLYPPVNSSGAKRAEALSKYMARMGHNVSVITPAKTLADGELTEEIPEGVNLIELDRSGRDSESRAIGKPYEPLYTDKRSLKRRVKDFAILMLGQVPDPRLPFIFSLRGKRLSLRADKALREADVVIGSCPPWSMLLGAVFVKRRYGMPIVLDYRDQFSDNCEMPGYGFAKWLERRLDRWLLKSADRVVAISDPMKDYYKDISGHDVVEIKNGFDHEKIDSVLASVSAPKRDGIIRIRHTGKASPKRLPTAFFKALVKFHAEDKEQADRIRLEFYGLTDVFARAIRTDYPEIAHLAEFFDTVPHRTSLELLATADYLLWCGVVNPTTPNARGILTSKLFEYLAVGRPILAHTDPSTLAADLIRSCGGDHVISKSEEDYLAFFKDPSFHAVKESFVGEKVSDLSRLSGAKKYAALLEDIRAN